MTSSTIEDDIVSADRSIKRSHKHAAYGTLMGGFALGLGALLLSGTKAEHRSTRPDGNDSRGTKRPEKPSRRPPGRIAWQDVLLLGIATHKITAMVAQDRVTQPVRRPFTENKGGQKQPTGGAMRHSVGELITCKYCLAPWIAVGLGAAYVHQPTATRFGASLFTMVSMSDFLNRGYSRLEKIA